MEVGGRTLLEITLARLREFNVNEVIVNVHHFAEMVVDYLKANNNFGMHIEISREKTLLDTGGGLKKASWFFLQDSITSLKSPFIVHNVDVISTIDLKRMLQFHKDSAALATLAVQERETSRYLLFDEHGHLSGRRAGNGGRPEVVLGSATSLPRCALGFSGIHVISPRIFEKMTEDGAFPIISTYLRLAAQGENICAFRADEYYWRDLGRLEDVGRAQADARVP